MSAIEEPGNTHDTGLRQNAVYASNDRVAGRARSLRFASRVPMRCECDDPGCRALILLALDDFHRLRASGLPVVAEDHERLRRSA